VLVLKKGAMGEAIGKSRGGLTSKIHVVTDGKGNAMNVIITAGNVHDSKKAQDLLDPVIHPNEAILGDRAFDTDKIIEYIASKMAVAVIPPKKNRIIKREYDKELYKNRNQIECFFNRLKQFRRIATRYDKLVSSFMALTQLAAALICIPKFSPIV